MPVRYGGPSPAALKQDRHVTAQAPAGTTAAAPVNVGDLFVLVGTADQASSGYRLAAATAADAANTQILVQAMARVESDLADVAVERIGFPGIVRLPYRAASGTPVLGQSVAIDTTDLRKVVGIAYAAGKGRILNVLTATTEVEVAF